MNDESGGGDQTRRGEFGLAKLSLCDTSSGVFTEDMSNPTAPHLGAVDIMSQSDTSASVLLGNTLVKIALRFGADKSVSCESILTDMPPGKTSGSMLPENTLVTIVLRFGPDKSVSCESILASVPPSDTSTSVLSENKKVTREGTPMNVLRHDASSSVPPAHMATNVSQFGANSTSNVPRASIIVPQFAVGPSLAHEHIRKIPRYGADLDLSPDDRPSKVPRIGTDTNVRSSTAMPPGGILPPARDVKKPTGNKKKKNICPLSQRIEKKGRDNLKKNIQIAPLPELRGDKKEAKDGFLFDKPPESVFYTQYHGVKLGLPRSADDSDEVNFVSHRTDKQSVAVVTADKEGSQALANSLLASAHRSTERFIVWWICLDHKNVAAAESQFADTVAEAGRRIGRKPCPNCLSLCHYLSHCPKPNQTFGSITGCPACNTRSHYFDNCSRVEAFMVAPGTSLIDLSQEAKEWFYEQLVVNRRNKPPVRSMKYSWVQLVCDLSRTNDPILRDGEYPLTLECSREVAAGVRPWSSYNPDCATSPDNAPIVLGTDPLFLDKHGSPIAAKELCSLYQDGKLDAQLYKGKKQTKADIAARTEAQAQVTAPPSAEQSLGGDAMEKDANDARVLEEDRDLVKLYHDALGSD